MTLPKGWSIRTLGEVAKWGSGGTPKAGAVSYYGAGYDWAVIGDLNDGFVKVTEKSITQSGLENSSAKVIPAGAIMIAMYGSIGKLGIAGHEMTSNQAIAFSTAHADVMDSKFLFFYLMSQRQAFLAQGKGATQQNISQTILKAWQVPVPPLEEQRRIVATLEDHLSRLDKALEVLVAAKSKLEVFRKSVYQAFGQAIAGADQKEILEVCNVYQPKTIAVKELNPTGKYPVFGANGQIGFFDEFNHEESEVTITCRGATCGTVNVIPAKSWITGNAMVVSPKTEDLNKEFLELHLRGLDYRGVITGTAQPQITRQSLSSLSIPVPDLAEQLRRVEEASSVLSSCYTSQESLTSAERKLREMRRSLLHSAFSGSLPTES